MNKGLIGIFTCCLVVYSSISFASNDVISSQLEGVITAHIAATSKDSESIDDVMKTMHTESPVTMHIKTQMEQVFPVFDVNTSLVNFSFVGMDGEYAITRAKQKVEKISGPAQLKSHTNKQIIIFKQENEQWKIWQMAMLDMDYL